MNLENYVGTDTKLTSVKPVKGKRNITMQYTKKNEHHHLRNMLEQLFPNHKSFEIFKEVVCVSNSFIVVAKSFSVESFLQVQKRNTDFLTYPGIGIVKISLIFSYLLLKIEEIASTIAKGIRVLLIEGSRLQRQVHQESEFLTQLKKKRDKTSRLRQFPKILSMNYCHIQIQFSSSCSV